MNELTMRLIGMIFVFGKLGLACFLEWKLAQKDEWYLGLILPFLYFWNSLMQIAMRYEEAEINVLLGLNVETIILLLLYGICITKKKQKKEYADMKVKDL